MPGRAERRSPELARRPSELRVVYGSRIEGMLPAAATAGVLPRRLVLMLALACSQSNASLHGRRGDE